MAKGCYASLNVSSMVEIISLALGTALLRPYVLIFLLIYLMSAGRDLGWRRTALLTALGWTVAFTAEFLSTRIGIPFGLYHYTGVTKGKELYLSNVPFFDSLSFTFLAYASFCLARWSLRQSGGARVVMLSGLLMMLLDVVIDPLAVRGDRWFLWRIFYYPEGGIYFGVPLSNFLGWAIVGWVILGGFLMISRPLEARTSGRPGLGVGLYYGVLAFNLVLTWWIGEPLLFAIGTLIHLAVFLVIWAIRGKESSHLFHAPLLGKEIRTL
jgi:putative membrane protein